MKTMRAVTVICWIITAIALAGIAVWFLTGTIFGFTSTRWEGWSFMRNAGGFESLTGPYNVVGSESVNATGINSIRIDWVAGEITVIPHDGSEFLVTESAQRELRNNETFYVTTSGDTLMIKYTERTISGRTPQKRLEVLVPRELSKNMHMLSIDTVSGEANVTDITAAILKTESISGRLDLSGVFGDVKVKTVSGGATLKNSAQNAVLDADTVSGRLELSGYFDKAVINSVSGGISFTSAIVPASIKADSISGSITIALPADAEISVNHSSVSGRLSSDIPVTMEGRGAVINISTVSGSTKITTLD